MSSPTAVFTCPALFPLCRRCAAALAALRTFTKSSLPVSLGYEAQLRTVYSVILYRTICPRLDARPTLGVYALSCGVRPTLPSVPATSVHPALLRCRFNVPRSLSSVPSTSERSRQSNLAEAQSSALLLLALPLFQRAVAQKANGGYRSEQSVPGPAVLLQVLRRGSGEAKEGQQGMEVKGGTWW